MKNMVTVCASGNSTIPGLQSPMSTINTLPIYSSSTADGIGLDRVHGRTKISPQRAIRLAGNNACQEKTWHLLRQRLISRVLIFLVTLDLLTLLDLMVVAPNMFINEQYTACMPDGAFSLSFDSYNPWKRNSIFAIDLKFGDLSFAQAKLIDVCWDVGVGRGVQVFLAGLAYKIFSRSLTHIMETTSVPYDTFKAITLQDNTFQGLLSLARSICRNKTRRVRGTIAWMITASSFVLLAAIWLSAMTGYVTLAKSFVADKYGNILPLTRFEPAIYTIHNGAMLENGKDEMVITVPWKPEYEMLDDKNTYSCINLSMSGENGTLEHYGDATKLSCKWAASVSYYVSQYGLLAASNLSNTTFYQPNNDTSLTTSINLLHPLNVSGHFTLADSNILSLYEQDPDYDLRSGQPYGIAWKDPSNGQRPFFQNNPMFWEATSGNLYSLAEINHNGSCQQTIGQTKYQWGFSYVLLYAFVLSLFIWLIGMWVLHCNSLLQSRLLDRKMGYERAIIDICRSALGMIKRAEYLNLVGNNELRALLGESFLTYSTLEFGAIRPTPLTRFRHDYSLKHWVKTEKWWLGALLTFSLLLILSWTTDLAYIWSPFIAMLPGLGVFLVLLVGRETHGRWTLFTVLFLVFLVFNIWWIWLMSRPCCALGWYHGNRYWPSVC